MAAVYTEKASLLPPNSDFVSSRSLIQGFWQGVLNMGVKGAKLQTVELEEHGDAAYEVGKYALLDTKAQTLDAGKYVVIWKREQGQWKWHRDIWNSSMPQR
jgi:ketosteroid isomerase-like protein